MGRFSFNIFLISNKYCLINENFIVSRSFNIREKLYSINIMHILYRNEKYTEIIHIRENSE